MEARRTNLVEEHGKGMIVGLRAGGERLYPVQRTYIQKSMVEYTHSVIRLLQASWFRKPCK